MDGLNEGTEAPIPEANTQNVEIKNAQAVLAKNAELIEELKSLKQFKGLNYQEVQEALQTQKSLREKELIKKGDYDTAKAELERASDARYKELATQFDTFLQKNAYKTLQAELISLGVDAGYSEDFAELLVLRHLQPTQKDGEITWINKNGVGDTANIAQIVEEYRVSKPRYFVSNLTAGSGASGSNGNGGNAKTMSKVQWDAMGVKEQAAFIKSGGSIAQ